jgi:hypothetical protein
VAHRWPSSALRTHADEQMGASFPSSFIWSRTRLGLRIEALDFDHDRFSFV